MSETIGINYIEERTNCEYYMGMSLTEWREELAQHCCCYVCDDQYLCKKFDQINFNFCTLGEAQEIVADNIYCLLRYKYLTQKNDDKIEKRILEIVRNFTSNLKTSLLKTTLRPFSSEECAKIRMLDAGEIAFHDGVYSFRKNDWLFKYNRKKIEGLNNAMYEYNCESSDPNGRVVNWYFDFDFEPYKEFVQYLFNTFTLDELLIKLEKEKFNNLCFELMCNMSHDYNDDFSDKKFLHLCEVIGYLLDNKPVQAFVMLIGSGQNGKNSLMDGCFTKRIRPAPIGNSLESLENDKFASGTLVNRYHNIVLETTANERAYRDSTNLKELTGGTEHTVEKKGENKFPTYINCKFLFSANDQDKVKFGDNTEGFKRRINMFELFYRWDKNKDFLKKNKGYYDTTFGNDLEEITGDILNTVMFIVFGMYGLKACTKDFTSTQFEFTVNDWNSSYTDVDFDLKEEIEYITVEKIVKYMTASAENKIACKTLFFDENRKRLYESPTLAEIGYNKGYDDLISLLRSPENYMSYFANNEVYMSVKVLKELVGYVESSNSFTSSLKKIYNVKKLDSLYNNTPYVKVNLNSGKIKIVNS